ncbi:winged helix-turn-helix transcriptional regulator [Paenibacillus massiliensis]|uniref:winged helix-turn-helix transcriptional regulator n=1 Tax=Paenibacillus massiliensis TaxID=225917 RepID=UPI00047271C5|nr:helix-turn-helix domain-containing protein [Paenibacillus massiliensis]
MKVCNDGFEQKFMDEKRYMYAIAFTQNVLSGRWKYFILWYLKNETRRYSDIKKFLGNLSQGSLTKQLKELENDGVIQREVYPEVPLWVEYSLTDKGEKLLPILEKMEEFGNLYSDKS